MKNTLKTLVIILLLITGVKVKAQQVHGTVYNGQGGAVPFANVVLHMAVDSSIVTGAVSEDDGSFSLEIPESGSFFIKVSAMGFKSHFSKVFPASEAPGKMSISLEPNQELLKEARVEALQARLLTKNDRMVVKVAGTAMAAGSSAYDVLQEAPGVWTDQNGELQLNGKSGVRVMINGRETYLSGDDLQQRLRAMSAENIKDIEVISNPSAKYEAEGTAGIINIVLKDITQRGFNGNIHGNYTYNKLHYYSGGLGLNYQRDKLSTSVDLDMNRTGRYREMSWYREYHQPDNTAVYTQDGGEEVRTLSPNLRLSADYDLNDIQSIGLSVNLSGTNRDQHWDTYGKLVDTNAATDVYIDSRNQVRDVSFDQNYNFHYQLKLDTNGGSLNTNFDYLRLDNTMDNRFTNNYSWMESGLGSQEIFTSHNPFAYDITALRVDYVKPFPAMKARLELGAKASHVLSDNSLKFYQMVKGVEHEMEERNNDFTYVEDIYATYANFSAPLSEKWELQAGLRAEYTKSEGNSKTLDQVNKRGYLSLFPSLFLQQKVSDNYQIGYSYSRRISRPRYSQLNPYVFYLDPYTFIQGTPNMRPQYSHNFQLTQTWKRKYNLMLGYDYTTDFISEVPSQNAREKTTILRTGNIDKFENLSATLVVPVQIGESMSLNNMITSAWQNYETVINEEFYRNEAFFFMARINATVKLPRQVVMEVVGMYTGPMVHGVYHLDGRGAVDIGFKKSFMNDKLDVALNAKDIFHTHYINGNVGLRENVALMHQYQGRQRIGLSLRYKFSKGKDFKARQQEQKLEELQRAGG